MGGGGRKLVVGDGSCSWSYSIMFIHDQFMWENASKVIFEFLINLPCKKWKLFKNWTL